MPSYNHTFKPTLQWPFLTTMPSSNCFYEAEERPVFHLWLAIGRRPELQPIHHTTINEIEKLHANCRNFDQQVLLYRKDFSANIKHPGKKQANDRLNKIKKKLFSILHR